MFIDVILALDTCGLVENLPCFRMPRTRVPRTDGGTCQKVVEVAGAEVANCSVAREYGVCHVSLHGFCVTLRKSETLKTGYKPHNREFDSKQEDYAKQAAHLYYGLSTRYLRSLVYLCAVHYKLKFPQKSLEPAMADTDWMNSFLKRIPSVSIRSLGVTNREGQ
jgi:hypothetical protein